MLGGKIVNITTLGLQGQFSTHYRRFQQQRRSGKLEEALKRLARICTNGSGYHLTAAGFRDNPHLDLSDTTLPTLSACEAGAGSNAGSGREVDGPTGSCQTAFPLTT